MDIHAALEEQRDGPLPAVASGEDQGGLAGRGFRLGVGSGVEKDPHRLGILDGPREPDDGPLAPRGMHQRGHPRRVAEVDVDALSQGRADLGEVAGSRGREEPPSCDADLVERPEQEEGHRAEGEREDRDEVAPDPSSPLVACGDAHSFVCWRGVKVNESPSTPISMV
jgi:hypothetical protein